MFSPLPTAIPPWETPGKMQVSRGDSGWRDGSNYWAFHEDRHRARGRSDDAGEVPDGALVLSGLALY